MPVVQNTSLRLGPLLLACPPPEPCFFPFFPFPPRRTFPHSATWTHVRVRRDRVVCPLRNGRVLANLLASKRFFFFFFVSLVLLRFSFFPASTSRDKTPAGSSLLLKSEVVCAPPRIFLPKTTDSSTLPLGNARVRFTFPSVFPPLPPPSLVF